MKGVFNIADVKTINGRQLVDTYSRETLLNKIDKDKINDDGVGSDELWSAKKVSEQIKENVQQIFRNQNDNINNLRSNGGRKCIVSFISDDGYESDIDILRPILEPLGVPCGMALVTGYSTTVKKDKVQELLKIGWDFSSHTVNHKRLPTLTDAEIEYELRESKKAVESMGVSCDYIVYPNGEHDARVRKIASKYYKFGLETKGKITTYPVKTYSISRVSLGSYFDKPTYNTLEYYKQKFDEAYASDSWLIYMLHGSAQEFDSIQRQHLVDVINYIKSFNIPIMTVSNAYKEYGNMISIGEDGDENLIITNAGDVFEPKAMYSNVLNNSTCAFKTGTENGCMPINFIDGSNMDITLTAITDIENPTIISTGKNIWGGLKAANDIITAVNNNNVAWYEVNDGKRCIALKSQSYVMKDFFKFGFIENTQYTISGMWKRKDTNTGNGGSIKFVHTDGTSTASIYPETSTWSAFKIGSTSGKTVKSISGNYGSNSENITYIDIDTLQLEIGINKSEFETYKETRLEVTTNLTANDVLKYENGLMFKNAIQVINKNNLKAFKNGTIYFKNGMCTTTSIRYCLNRSADKELGINTSN